VSAAAKPSEQQSASRKSNLLKDQKSLFLFFEINRTIKSSIINISDDVNNDLVLLCQRTLIERQIHNGLS
jgi:hypothetical protein